MPLSDLPTLSGIGQRPNGKGETRKRAKGRKERSERAMKRSVRAECVERDGYCRLRGLAPGNCDGPSEWAHLEDGRRARTRGMDPEKRHTTARTAMLCRVHHRAYDARAFRLRFLTRKGADGPLTVTWPTDEPRVQRGVMEIRLS